MEPPPQLPPSKRPRHQVAVNVSVTAPATLCITHAACLKHYVGSRNHPEQPARVASVMASLRDLLDEQYTGKNNAEGFLFNLQEMESSPAMLTMLEKQLSELTKEAPQTKVVGLQRSESVAYLESTILPAVRAVHTPRYLERLQATCQHLSDRAANKPRAQPTLARNLSGVTGDTFASASSLSAALCAALSACRAVDAVCKGEAPNAFAAIRPPGHHAGADGCIAGPATFDRDASIDEAEVEDMPAEPSLTRGLSASIRPLSAAGASQALEASCNGAGGGGDPSEGSCDAPASTAPAVEQMSDVASESTGVDKDAADADDRCGQGFCLLNNAAIAAKHALLRYQPPHVCGIARVAILDIDLHHGNGTQEIVRHWPEVMYASIHGAEEGFYPSTATSLQTEPRLVNVPLARGTSSDEYLDAFDTHIASALRTFAPDLLILSTGFDAHRDDAPDLSGFLRLEASTFASLTRRCLDLAAELCAGRLVSLLEGGYNLSALAECTRAHVMELARAAGATANAPSSAAVPVAAPIAAPIATPIAAPITTPIATPIATPPMAAPPVSMGPPATLVPAPGMYAPGAAMMPMGALPLGVHAAAMAAGAQHTLMPAGVMPQMQMQMMAAPAPARPKGRAKKHVPLDPTSAAVAAALEAANAAATAAATVAATTAATNAATAALQRVRDYGIFDGLSPAAASPTTTAAAAATAAAPAAPIAKTLSLDIVPDAQREARRVGAAPDASAAEGRNASTVPITIQQLTAECDLSTATALGAALGATAASSTALQPLPLSVAPVAEAALPMQPGCSSPSAEAMVQIASAIAAAGAASSAAMLWAGGSPLAKPSSPKPKAKGPRQPRQPKAKAKPPPSAATAALSAAAAAATAAASYIQKTHGGSALISPAVPTGELHATATGLGAGVALGVPSPHNTPGMYMAGSGVGACSVWPPVPMAEASGVPAEGEGVEVSEAGEEDQDAVAWADGTAAISP